MSHPERGGFNEQEWNQELEKTVSIALTKRQALTLRATLANDLHASHERLNRLASLQEPEPQDQADYATFLAHIDSLNQINEILVRSIDG